MHLFGFSAERALAIRLVLAIGIVVDDAIVVVENVERHMRWHADGGTRQAIRE